MALSPETQAWLDELKKEGSLTDEAYNQLKATFENQKVNDYVKGSVLRQSDYSRNSAAIQAAKTELETAQAALTQREKDVTDFQTTLGTWKAGADVNYNKALQDREAAERKASAAFARLKTLGVASGLSEEEVLRDLEVVEVPDDKKVQAVDTTGFLRKEDLQRGIAESALVDASIHDVATRHYELTGKPLRDAAGLVTEAIKAGKSITQYADEKFGFAKLETDQAAANIKKQIDDGIAAGVAQKLSEAGLPGSLAPGRRMGMQGSPILGITKEGGLAAPPPTPGAGISAAVAAFNAGTYDRNK